MENYVGQVVFFDTKKSYPKGDEIIVVRQSQNRLFGIPTKCSDYGGHELKSVDLVGSEAAEIVSHAAADAATITQMITDLEYFADYEKRGERKHWIESVYAGARRNAELLRELLKKQNDCCAQAVKISDQLSRLAATLREHNL